MSRDFADVTSLKFCDEGYSDGLNIITRDLIRETGKRNKIKRRKCDKEKRCWNGKREGPRTKGCVQTLEAGKVKETNTP